MGNKATCTSSDSKNKKFLDNRFKVSDKLIGKGSFATVTLGSDVKSKKKVAIRNIPLHSVCPVTLEHLRREAELHPLLDHENIVKVLFCRSEEDNITMVLEYVKDGSLLDYYAKKRSMHEFEVRNIFLQLLDAVEYMHSQGIVHRDIKLDNILIDASSQTIKLADFGFADRFDQDTLFRNFPGTLAYSPPEVLRGEPHRAAPRDIWSCGVLLYILLTGKYPFGSQPNSKTKNRILNEEPNWEAMKISGSVKDLLRRMLHKDAAQRITLREVRNHAWCRAGSQFFRRNGLLRRASSLAADLVPQPLDKRPSPDTLEPNKGTPTLAVGAPAIPVNA